jgi:naphthalene 1,2-dioxygenase ferredoxin reductase component
LALRRSAGADRRMNIGSDSDNRIVRLRVQPRGIELTARVGRRLLDVLREHSLPVSYSCEAGRCGVCRCELLAGRVVEDPDREFREGPAPEGVRRILACSTRLSEDCEIGLIEPDEIVSHPAQTLKCTVLDSRRLSASVTGLTLRPNRMLRFSAGQFVKVTFEPKLTRFYSLANEEGSELLELHVRRLSQGRASNWIDARLRCGDIVKLQGPLGTSYLRRTHTGPTLCIAGGTGLAPILSIVRTALAVGTTGRLHVYVGARAASDLYMVDELRRLQHMHSRFARLEFVVDESASTSLRTGFVTQAVVQDVGSLSGWKVYLAGPPPMVESGVCLAVERGAAAADIHADAFYASSDGAS